MQVEESLDSELENLFSRQRHADSFGKEFVQALATRRDKILEIREKVAIFQNLISGALLVSVLSSDLNILGFSTAGNKLREILLIAGALATARNIVKLKNVKAITHVLEVYTRMRYQNDRIAIALARMSVGLDFEREIERQIVGFRGVLSIVSFGISLVIYLFAHIAIHLYAVVDILRSPGFSLTVSILVAVFVLLIDLASIDDGALEEAKIRHLGNNCSH